MMNLVGIIIVVLIVASLLRSTQQKNTGANRDDVPFPDEPEIPDEPVDVEAKIVPDEEPEPLPLPEPQPEPAAEVKPEPASAEPLPPESLAMQFFAKSFPGEAEKKAFEALKGTSVQWHGTLKNACPFSSDFIFGMKKGVRATIELCEVADSYGFKRKVACVAAFSADSAALLKEKTGRTVAFRGTLHSMEPVTKEIRLDNAELI